jgi:hypothetical protein
VPADAVTPLGFLTSTAECHHKKQATLATYTNSASSFHTNGIGVCLDVHSR